MRGKYLCILILTLTCACAISPPKASASSCKDLEIIFARGSGADIKNDQNYDAFRAALETKLKTTKLSYGFTSLDYPAVGVGIENLKVTLGALFGAGDAYEFGASVNTGVKNLVHTVNASACKNTKYILAGYSQGAMVVSKSLPKLNADQIIFAATFGDPKIYLPEGKGLFPAACNNKNLSEYRIYVPDCRTYKGLLGAYEPYQPSNFKNKLGTWCNKHDIFCSSRFNMGDHLAYISAGLYEDAARLIFDKIAKHFNFKNTVTSPHDTVILIDSSGSMSSYIEKYKHEALRLAHETLTTGGRVALYDYRDLADPYQPRGHCDFNTCTLETVARGLESIVVDGGGDAPESLLSASWHIMKSLNWKFGATKSFVVLTDAEYISPDRDGTSVAEVISLSKTIDPVNFYIITESSNADFYQTLASGTDGQVFTNFDELHLLTDHIMERFDSLPRVEEESNDSPEIPHVTITNVHETSSAAHVDFSTDAEAVIVALNDKILGLTKESNITITDLKNQENVIALTPIKNDLRGETKLAVLNFEGRGGSEDSSEVPAFFIPKAPNTGAR